MRIGTVVGVGLLLLSSFAAPALAAEVYLLGGLVMANLGGDAEQFGDAVADGIQAELGGSWTSNKKMRTGLDIGMGTRYGASDVVGGVVELHYATRGVKFELRGADVPGAAGNTVTVTETMKFNYIEMPVLLELTPAVSGSVRPVFMVGPVLGIKASAKLTAEAEGTSQDVDLGSGTNSVAFGGLIGTGVKIRAGASSNLMLQVRFQAGLSNLIDDPTLSFKPRDFSIVAGWSTAP